MDDVIGLEQAKKALHETIVLPNLRPDVGCLHALDTLHCSCDVLDPVC